MMASVHSYKMCAKQNMTVDQTAEFLGVSKGAVLSVAARFDIFFVGQAPVPQAWAKSGEHNAPIQCATVEMPKVFRMAAVGHPPAVIAEVTGLTRGQVVEQLDEWQHG